MPIWACCDLEGSALTGGGSGDRAPVFLWAAGASEACASRSRHGARLRTGFPSSTYGATTMDTFVLRIFQQQLLSQCRYLIFAAADANEGLKQHDAERIFYAIQNLLNAGANISKTLWGQGGKRDDDR